MYLQGQMRRDSFSFLCTTCKVWLSVSQQIQQFEPKIAGKICSENRMWFAFSHSDLLPLCSRFFYSLFQVFIVGRHHMLHFLLISFRKFLHLSTELLFSFSFLLRNNNPAELLGQWHRRAQHQLDRNLVWWWHPVCDSFRLTTCPFDHQPHKQQEFGGLQHFHLGSNLTVSDSRSCKPFRGNFVHSPQKFLAYFVLITENNHHGMPSRKNEPVEFGFPPWYSDRPFPWPDFSVLLCAVFRFVPVMRITL